MALIQTVVPASEPITLNEARLHVRVDDTAEDTLITRNIRAARAYAETFTGRQLVTATYQRTLSNFAGTIKLRPSPLQSVSNITYVDSNGDTQTVATSIYSVDTYGLIGSVYPAYGQSWPSSRGMPNDVTIIFKAGHATVFTAATSDTLTWTNRTPADGEAVVLTNSGGASGALPAGLSANTTYYVISASGQTCELSTSSGGSAVDITDTGTGTHFIGEVPENIREAMLLLIGHWFVNREAVVTGTIVTEMKRAVDRLLWNSRIMEAR